MRVRGYSCTGLVTLHPLEQKLKIIIYSALRVSETQTTITWSPLSLSSTQTIPITSANKTPHEYFRKRHACQFSGQAQTKSGDEPLIGNLSTRDDLPNLRCWDILSVNNYRHLIRLPPNYFCCSVTRMSLTVIFHESLGLEARI